MQTHSLPLCFNTGQVYIAVFHLNLSENLTMSLAGHSNFVHGISSRKFQTQSHSNTVQNLTVSKVFGSAYNFRIIAVHQNCFCSSAGEMETD